MSLAENKTFQLCVFCFLFFALGFTVGMLVSYKIDQFYEPVVEPKVSVWRDTSPSHKFDEWEEMQPRQYVGKYGDSGKVFIEADSANTKGVVFKDVFIDTTVAYLTNCKGYKSGDTVSIILGMGKVHIAIAK